VLVKNKISNRGKIAMNGILHAYMGKLPDKFEFQGKSYIAKSFAGFLSICPDDYIELSLSTSASLQTICSESTRLLVLEYDLKTGLNEMQETAD